MTKRLFKVKIQKKSLMANENLAFTPFKQIPTDIYKTPKTILSFILNEFKNNNSFDDTPQIGSKPKG